MATKTILCADDSPACLCSWIEVFDQFGYRAIATTDARAVLPILNSLPVQLVVLDYFMPVINGGAIAASIRESNPTPIVLTSNSIHEIPSSVQTLVSAVVPKQQGLAALMRVVHDLLRDDCS